MVDLEGERLKPMKRRIGITCATSGLAIALCERLAGSEVEIVAMARNMEKVHQLKERFAGEAKATVLPVELDFEDRDTLFRIRDSDSIGGLDGIVLFYPRVDKHADPFPPLDASLPTWRKCFLSPVELIGYLVPKMRDGCRVVIVSGITNTQVFPALGMANALRAAWLAQAKLLAFSLADRGIRVNTLSLGGTLTPAFMEIVASSTAPPGALNDHPGAIPLGEYGTPANVAYVIDTLLGEFAFHMTGANIVCDGGLSRHYF